GAERSPVEQAWRPDRPLGVPGGRDGGSGVPRWVALHETLDPPRRAAARPDRARAAPIHLPSVRGDPRRAARTHGSGVRVRLLVARLRRARRVADLRRLPAAPRAVLGAAMARPRRPGARGPPDGPGPE